MGEVVIQVENLSKVYQLGTIGTGTIKQDLSRWWNTSVLKKEDSFYYPQTSEETSASNQGQKAFWALQDVSFEIKQGEVWGIIGNNGAGKSTLLKIISRIVKPTKGVIRGKGKISSLLEVGTGFNQELTGRENIFLSGYILGMTKREINAKFDEIVDFSGIEKFLDTPVKRYSSGMYVRLAFAVAAHLEPDILIIDEVLAVGDAEFQKKCLGKVRDVSKSEGRTILFVSHSMQAVGSLCDHGLWLQKGRLMETGPASTVINNYLKGVKKFQLHHSWSNMVEAPGNEFVRFKSIRLIPHLSDLDAPLDIRTPLTVKFQLWNLVDDQALSVGLHLFSYGGECIFDIPSPTVSCQKGIVEGECTIPGNFLNDGSYYISLIVVKDTSVNLFYHEECLAFELEDYRGDIKWFGKWMGAVRPSFPFHIEQKELVIQEEPQLP
ncbi:ABC transporter ATP-binding protein [Rufibacter latericius]|uniref:ABC transporter ATP-binding protein n=1 Tax=Rufibacter latericius TaxID=2487040 RepID=A0A3M9MG61_9BACT|nr:ABC transporter ATP-binding protein [Rufibacter latericius]RNI24542.1 ABC transporter ATP-binding protein [Rufibacter latericius]